MKEQLKYQQNTTVVELECQLADTTQQLLLEVTALRAKLAEVDGDKLNSEKIARAHLIDEYDKLVRGLFTAVFQLNHRFDEFRYFCHVDAHCCHAGTALKHPVQTRLSRHL